MELKILCPCGQKYKFDVEPTGGRMPFAVNCPVCNVDGTENANTLLAEHFRLTPPPRATAPPQFAPGPSAVPMAPQFSAPPPPPLAVVSSPPPVGSLRINREVHAAPPPVPAMNTMPPTGTIGAIRPVVPASKSKIKVQGDFSLMRGILGACIGAVVSCGLLVAFWIWAGFRFPLSGVAVGVASGFGAKLMARGTDTTLGYITAGIAAASVIGTFMWMYKGEFPIINIISVAVCVSFAYRTSSG